MQAECFVELKQQAEKNTAATQHLLERVGSLKTRVNVVERLQDALEQRVELLDDRREMHSDRYAGRIDVVEDQTAKATNTVAQLQRRLDEIRIGGRNSTGQLSGYISEGGLSILGVAANVTPRRIETIHSKVTELEHSVDRCLSSSMDHDLRLQLLERATYNGILIWKIDDFKRRRKEAVDGVTMSLYSSPFYTSRHGYRMCARVDLNGDGLGKNTHFSFFFAIMRGPYDPLLPWPFRQKVTLTLLNQTEKKHVTDHFRPDPHSSSFQRPGNKREMNIASGCPMFIRIEDLLSGGFVKDDAAYIRIVVDTSDLPEIMPWVLTNLIQCNVIPLSFYTLYFSVMDILSFV